METGIHLHANIINIQIRHHYQYTVCFYNTMLPHGGIQ